MRWPFRGGTRWAVSLTVIVGTIAGAALLMSLRGLGDKLPRDVATGETVASRFVRRVAHITVTDDLIEDPVIVDVEPIDNTVDLELGISVVNSSSSVLLATTAQASCGCVGFEVTQDLMPGHGDTWLLRVRRVDGAPMTRIGVQVPLSTGGAMVIDICVPSAHERRLVAWCRGIGAVSNSPVTEPHSIEIFAVCPVSTPQPILSCAIDWIDGTTTNCVVSAPVQLQDGDQCGRSVWHSQATPLPSGALSGGVAIVGAPGWPEVLVRIGGDSYWPKKED